MSDDRYDVVFYGDLVEGHTVSQVKQEFARIFSITEEKVEEIFSRAKSILKPDVDHTTAKKYQDVLHGLGAKTVLESRSESTSTAHETQQPVTSVVEQAESEEAAPTDESESSVDVPVVAAVSQQAASLETVQTRQAPFKFSGTGTEYFKIWIVNIVLSILTLGIYSAWAKVRNKRYFYGNTTVDGSAFEYTAKPIPILIGRIIAVTLFAGYVFLGGLSPALGLLAAGILLILTPWIIVKSLRFNARNSVYRNIRLGFDGKAFPAFLYFVLYPLLSVFTFFLVYPLIYKKQQEFLASNHRYGSTLFKFGAGAGDYYIIFLMAMGVSMGVGVVLAIIGGIVAATAGAFGGEAVVQLLFIPAMLFYILMYLSVYVYFSMARLNLLFNNTQIAGHSFTSNIRFGSFLKLHFLNTLGILFTLGLFIPWAKVRTARYRADHLTLNVQGDLDAFVAAEEANSNPLGEEVGEFFDIDIAF